MTIQDHLDAFDRWLTSRIVEAHAAHRDLAFRDLGADLRLGDAAWEYSLLTPGGSRPVGDGWSVYRLQGVWPESAQLDDATENRETVAERPHRTFLGLIADVVLGPKR
jgi:hypothetical protein